MDKVILHGGGPDLKKIFTDLRGEKVFNGLSVVYVICAIEKSVSLRQKFQNEWPETAAFLKKLGAIRAEAVDSENFSHICEFDTVILADGSSEYLLPQLVKLKFRRRLLNSDIKNVIGIGAGAIALSVQGIGTKNYVEFAYDGFGIVDERIMLHYRPGKGKNYPDFIKLMDYQYLERSVCGRYSEAGWDTEHNMFGLGVFSRIDYRDEGERYFPGLCRKRVREIYLRLRFLRYALIIGNKGIKLFRKKDYKFKLTVGWGEKL